MDPGRYNARRNRRRPVPSPHRLAPYDTRFLHPYAGLPPRIPRLPLQSGLRAETLIHAAHYTGAGIAQYWPRYT